MWPNLLGGCVLDAMNEKQAKIKLQSNYSKEKLREMYKRGCKHINVPISVNGSGYKFSIIELLNDL